MTYIFPQFYDSINFIKYVDFSAIPTREKQMVMKGVTRSKASRKELHFCSSYGGTLVSRSRRRLDRGLARSDLDDGNRFHRQNSRPERKNLGGAVRRVSSKGWRGSPLGRKAVRSLDFLFCRRSVFFIVVPTFLPPLTAVKLSPWELGICGLPWEC